MWFEELTGFKEVSPNQVRKNLSLDGDKLTSEVTGNSMICGTLTTPSLGNLREKVRSLNVAAGELSLNEIVVDVQELHKDKENAASLFQVASQFNLLEMVSPDISPESGVDGYEYDQTQGPACAVAAGAGTLFRNYFVTVNGKPGQSINRQIDTLSDLGEALGNSSHKLWYMKNGYALATAEGLMRISELLKHKSDLEIDKLRSALRIGIQHNTEVTISDSNHKVTQAYCSALPVAYSQHSTSLWMPFASLVLEASYEATMCAGLINAVNLGSNKVFLTMLGGGAFGNETNWIIKAIERALVLHKDKNLNVYIVSYGSSNQHVKALVDRFNQGSV